MADQTPQQAQRRFEVGAGARSKFTGDVFRVLLVNERANAIQLRHPNGLGVWGDLAAYDPAPAPIDEVDEDEVTVWHENVLTENPVEGRIHAGVSHADALTELSFILANAMEAKGFGLGDLDPEDPNFANMISSKLMLAVGELSEAQEELRAGHSYSEMYEKDGKPEGFAVELADAIYRLLHLAAALGIDIGLVLLQKHEFNLTRPHKHGKQF